MPLCPVCHDPLIQVEEAEVTAAACGQCHGTWISQAALQRRTRLETLPGGPHLTLPPLAALADTVAHSNTAAPLSCPDCKRIMTKDRFHPKIPVQIDRCDACQHVWLDAGEQGLLIDLYRELMANQPQAALSQQRLDNLQAIQRPSTYNYDSNSSGYSGQGIDTAVNVGIAVVGALVDIFLLPSGYHSYHRW
jgi:Zn-finger nucleic acid-binding protein